MRRRDAIALSMAASLALQGCMVSVPVAVGGPVKMPGFLLLREDVTITSLKVDCRQGDKWQTMWHVAGATSEGAFDYGLTPAGMKVLVAAKELNEDGDICQLEAKGDRRGKSRTSYVLWGTTDPVTQCGSERDCRNKIISTIT